LKGWEFNIVQGVRSQRSVIHIELLFLELFSDHSYILAIIRAYSHFFHWALQPFDFWFFERRMGKSGQIGSEYLWVKDQIEEAECLLLSHSQWSYIQFLEIPELIKERGTLALFFEFWCFFLISNFNIISNVDMSLRFCILWLFWASYCVLDLLLWLLIIIVVSIMRVDDWI
jgi:hypothetical protein